MLDVINTPPIEWKTFFRTHLWNEQTGRAPTPEMEQLVHFVCRAYETEEIYPPQQHLFAAFAHVPPEQVRVVILGQDPYHEPGQAHGLSFSVPEGTKLPPSLRNMFKEVQTDLGVEPLTSGDLTRWACQGVLLLNSVLTVRRGEAASHRGRGWELFTDAVLSYLDAQPTPIAFVLWGRDARSKRHLLRNPTHLVIEADHPSPLSAWRGFFGSRPYSQVNAYLAEHGEREIDWR